MGRRHLFCRAGLRLADQCFELALSASRAVHFDQGGDDAADHLRQEGVGLDVYEYEVALRLKGCLRPNTLRTSAARLRGLGEGSEIVPASEAGRHLGHGLKIERAGQVPDEVPQEYRPRLPQVEGIAIPPVKGGAP